MQILIIEDDRQLADLLRGRLEEEGHSVLLAAEGRYGFELAPTTDVDVIVLDTTLPGMDGFSVAGNLRKDGVRTPILMLAGRDAPEDIVRALDLGADDYLTKPFSSDVLLARLRALARRGPVARPVQLRTSDLTLDPATREVRRGGHTISLTRTEYSLLEVLMRRAGATVPREALISAVWGYDAEIGGNTLEAFIKSLRRKIDAGHVHPLIHTVRGVGYALREMPP